jgi:anti-sigma regulatory factor (Ser/Thr protein kinase)
MNSITVPATLESLEVLAGFVLEAAGAAGLGPDATYRLRLAAEEFATNIILHAYPAATPGTIEMHAQMDERTLTVRIEDMGVPFDPRQFPPPSDLHLPPEQRRPGGLGVYLALQSVDRYGYERVGERNRSVLVMNRIPAPWSV